MMYLRVLIIVAMFDWALVVALAPALLGLAVLGLSLAGLWSWVGAAPAAASSPSEAPANPLELMVALVFATMFVVVSVASAWVRTRFGAGGIYGLAAVVGVTDINPFVLSIASGGAAPLPLRNEAAAILIAVSSNNILQAVYAAGLAGARAALVPAAALLLLAVTGGGIAWWTAAAGP
jgi:uncharacterized membrane protein (DUF4010 family)